MYASTTSKYYNTSIDIYGSEVVAISYGWSLLYIYSNSVFVNIRSVVSAAQIAYIYMHVPWYIIA